MTVLFLPNFFFAPQRSRLGIPFRGGDPNLLFPTNEMYKGGGIKGQIKKRRLNEEDGKSKVSDNESSRKLSERWN
jgi:hypothetical protein